MNMIAKCEQRINKKSCGVSSSLKGEQFFCQSSGYFIIRCCKNVFQFLRALNCLEVVGSLKCFTGRYLKILFLSVTLFCGPAIHVLLYHLLVKCLWCLQSFVKYQTFVEFSFIEYKTLPSMLSQQVLVTSTTAVGVNSTYTLSRLIFFVFVHFPILLCFRAICMYDQTPTGSLSSLVKLEEGLKTYGLLK